jgi:hypothetical protein
LFFPCSPESETPSRTLWQSRLIVAKFAVAKCGQDLLAVGRGRPEPALPSRTPFQTAANCGQRANCVNRLLGRPLFWPRLAAVGLVPTMTPAANCCKIAVSSVKANLAPQADMAKRRYISTTSKLGPDMAKRRHISTTSKLGQVACGWPRLYTCRYRVTDAAENRKLCGRFSVGNLPTSGVLGSTSQLDLARAANA